MEPPYDVLDELGQGGMAIVYRGRPWAGGSEIALKRPRPIAPQGNERMKREITVLSSIDHPHIMPVVDSFTGEDCWYAMPIAQGNLRELWESGWLGSDANTVVKRVLEEVSLGLGRLHALGYVHRDVKPTNVLALEDYRGIGSYRWVIADLGLVRQPVGETTAKLTGTASGLGTLGFAAPELFADPHSVSAAADIYGLGRILAWLLTGESPRHNQTLLPSGAWRGLIREMTAGLVESRPKSVEDARERAAELLSQPAASPKSQLRLAVGAGEGISPAHPLWDVIADLSDDEDFMIDDVAMMRANDVCSWAETSPENASRAAVAMARHLRHGTWGYRSFNYANVPLMWIFSVLRGLRLAGRTELLEDVAVEFCPAEAEWNRFEQQARTRAWLRSLDEETGVAMARAIAQSGVVGFYRGLVERDSMNSVALRELLKD